MTFKLLCLCLFICFSSPCFAQAGKNMESYVLQYLRLRNNIPSDETEALMKFEKKSKNEEVLLNLDDKNQYRKYAKDIIKIIENKKLEKRIIKILTLANKGNKWWFILNKTDIYKNSYEIEKNTFVGSFKIFDKDSLNKHLYDDYKYPYKVSEYKEKPLLEDDVIVSNLQRQDFVEKYVKWRNEVKPNRAYAKKYWKEDGYIGVTSSKEAFDYFLKYQYPKLNFAVENEIKRKVEINDVILNDKGVYRVEFETTDITQDYKEIKTNWYALIKLGWKKGVIKDKNFSGFFVKNYDQFRH